MCHCSKFLIWGFVGGHPAPNCHWVGNALRTSKIDAAGVTSFTLVHGHNPVVRHCSKFLICRRVWRSVGGHSIANYRWVGDALRTSKIGATRVTPFTLMLGHNPVSCRWKSKCNH